MTRTFTYFAGVPLLGAVLVLCSLPSFAISFGKKDKEAVAKVEHGEPFKGQRAYAVGAFRVAFVTEDTVAAVSKGGFSDKMSASSRMSGQLLGVDHALMQKITDAIYADFLKQAEAKGFTLVDAASLAQKSAAYAAMAQTTSFDEGRLGTFVVPTGQRSVPLGADGGKKIGKGSIGIMDAWRMNAQTMEKAEANDVFPKISQEVGMPVLAVTLVVNFANFKGNGTSSWTSSAKTSIVSGATIDGVPKAGGLPQTAIYGWGAKTNTCALCMGMVTQEGQIHSEVSIGALDAHSDMKTGDHIANAIGILGGTGTYNKKMGVVNADPVAYETNVLLVAAESTELLLDGMTKEK
jgi:hypothetical protein